MSYINYLPQAFTKFDADGNGKLDYDEFNPFDICAESYTPIYRGEEKVECPFCTAKFKPEFRERGLLLVELYYTQFLLNTLLFSY